MTIPIKFGDRFISNYGGRLVTDPKIAIVELIANSYDAASTQVDIKWPEFGGDFSISDNGTGMSRDEFEQIWAVLNYNRIEKVGEIICFPDNPDKKRIVYGRNGKGRLSLFCFDNKYMVETWKDGIVNYFEVEMSNGENPLRIIFLGTDKKNGHGTIISCKINKKFLTEDVLIAAIGSKFIVDPEFKIFINSVLIEPEDSTNFQERKSFNYSNNEIITITKYESESSSRISRQHGVAWWVNKRKVGEHSWRGFDDTYLDGRTALAKRLTFIVEADFLLDEIEPDWSNFIETERVKKVMLFVQDRILSMLGDVIKNNNRKTKIMLISQNRYDIDKMSLLSREQVSHYIDELQVNCPSMKEKDLSNSVKIFTKLEHARSGYSLLEKLSGLHEEDFDAIENILNEWSISEAKNVLDELGKRITIINKIEELMDNPNTNELKELHPLIESGLWIFGPEYEGVKYHPNKTINTIIKNLLGKKVNVDNGNLRPDFVLTPDSIISGFCSPSYDEKGIVAGYDKLLIVEIKKGGFTIGIEEMRQAQDYAISIRNAGKGFDRTVISGYVLGSKHDTKVNILTWGNEVKIIPLPYNVLISQARARTFNLIKTIKEMKEIHDDEDIVEALGQPIQTKLFDTPE